jgi:hypothetical protein
VSEAAPSRRGTAAATVACVGIAAIAAGQALVSHPPALWFDVDPAADPSPYAGIAPSTGLLLDSLSLVLAAGAVLAVRRGIDRVGAALVALAALGMLPVAWHAARGADDALRGLQWAGAMGGAAAIAVSLRAMPAARMRVVRAVALGILLGAAVPMAVRGGYQLWKEHPATVAHYRAHRAEVLAARGWAEGSPQQLTFERRLMQPEATAWFGLSNVASGVLGAGALALAGSAFALRRRRPAGALLVGAAAIACAAVALANGSKGAGAALGLGGAFAAWCALASPSAKARALVAAALVALPVAAVAVRGQVGERSAERSMLFRAHYAQAAVDMAVTHPVAGVGPAGFGDAYLLARPDASPEEVQSAHAAWADWLAALGAGGAAWIVLLAALLALAAAGSVDRGDAPRDGSDAWTRGPMAAALAAAVAATVAIVPEAHALDDHSLLMRALAALLGGAIAGAAVRAALVGGRAWSAAVAGAAVMLAVHAQVEMVLWWPGAAGWAAALLAVAAVDPASPVRPDARASAAAAACAALLVAPAVIGLGSFDRARAAERRMDDAALPLAIFARARAGEDVPRVTTLDHARFQAAELLLGEPRDAWTQRPQSLAAGLEQAAAAVAGLPADASVQVRAARCRRALGMAAIALGAGSPERVASAAALVAESMLGQPGDVVDADAVEDLLRRAAARQVACNPRGVRGWDRLAGCALRDGRAADAIDAARRALAADDSFALDPLRRLPAADRARLEALAAGEVTSPAPTAPPR